MENKYKEKMMDKIKGNLLLFRAIWRIVPFLLLVTMFFTAPAGATHFRYGHLTWQPRPDIAPNTAEFELINAFRWSGYGSPPVGAIITETIGATTLHFGDGTSTPVLQYVVIAIFPSQNYLIGRALQPGTTTPNIIHTYSAPLNPATNSPWVADISSCCRISTLVNNPDGNYRVETQVRFDISNRSPVSTMPAIINAPINSNFSFFVPGADANGDQLTWRFSTAAESGITDPIGPPGLPNNPLVLNSATGEITWNTTGGTAIGQLYCAQVTIEERRGGVLIGKVAVDFILEIVGVVGDPPVCNINPPGPFVIQENQPLSFVVSASDPNAGDMITLNTAGLPTGATMTPGLPISGPHTGISSTFNWTPATGQAGVYLVQFVVFDNTGLQSSCTAQITVNPPSTNDPPACAITPPGPFTVAEGSPVSFTVSAADPNSGDVITLTGSSLPPGATMAPSLPHSGPNTGISSTFSWTPAPGQAGSYTITYTVTDNQNASSQCNVQINVTPSGVDNTKPSCNIVVVPNSSPTALDITLSDAGSGVATIKVVKLSNATLEIPYGSGNFYTKGQTAVISPAQASALARATKVKNNKSSTIALKVTDAAGNSVSCDPVYSTISEVVPEGFDLQQNYPNPFNPSTTIRFSVAATEARADFVTLKIYDLTGQEVRTLINEAVAPGEYAVEWNATDNHGRKVAAGVYLYRITVGSFAQTRKMILAK